MSETPAVDTAIAEKKEAGYGSITFDGAEYAIERKPNALLLSEMSRISSGDPEAFGVLAEFCQITLGDSYPAFKKAFYRSDAANTDEALMEIVQDVMEKTLGRPTQ